MAEDLYQSGTISTKSKDKAGRRLVKPKFPKLSFSTVGYKEVFPPQPPRKRKLEGGGHRDNFRSEYSNLLFRFDDRHHSNLYAATYQAANGIPVRVNRELIAAGKSRPMFGRRNPEIEAAKQAIYDRGIADTRAMLIAAGNVLGNLTVLNPNEYADFFERVARQTMPITDVRTTVIINRFIQQHRRFISRIGDDNGWINRGSDNYLALIRRLNDEVQNGLNQIVNLAGNIVTVNPIALQDAPAAPAALQHRDIPRGTEDTVTLDEIEDNELMIDLDRNYATGKYMKASTVDNMPLRGEVLINPYTNAPARIIQPYLARLVDAPAGGRLKCPICKKMIGKKH